MADYPRLLVLDPDTEERLISYIDDELDNHYAERGFWIDKVMGWQRDYWAEPGTKKKTFPFYGASNLVVPLTAISVEAVHARSMTTLFAIRPIVNADLRIKDFPSGGESALENYLDFELMKTVKIYRPFNDIVLETEKYGTGIGKSSYEKVVRKAVRTVGTREEEFNVTVRSTATLDAVAITRFMMPFVEQDPQTAAWCGEEHSSTMFAVKQLTESKMFFPNTYENLLVWVDNSDRPTDSGSGQEITTTQEELEERKPLRPRRLDFLELWLGFDIDGDGKDEEIQVFYHRSSRFLMAVRYNWYEDLRRPYRYSNYIPVEHRWNGIGICKQNEQFQREITTIHRQRLDNATLANMRMFKVHKLSGYGPNEPVFPGKMWFLDDMAHIETVQMGEVYQSSYANEQSSLVYSQQRTGVNEVILGMPQVGTPGTATGDLARIQEGNKKFDFSFKNIKTTLNDLVMDVVLNIHQFGTQNVEYFQIVENGHLIVQLLQQPASVISRGILFEVGLAGQQQNRLLDRNNWTQITAFLQQYYASIAEIAQLVGDQELMQMILKKALAASTEAMRQILESFEIRNVDRIILAELEGLIDTSTRAALPPGRDSNRGGAGGVTPADSGTGMANIQAVLAQIGGPS